MNLLKSKLRRPVAVAAGALVGLAGIAVFAAPASAHAPSVGGETSCIADGKWTVDWSIGNDYKTDATIKNVATDLKIEVKKDGKWSTVANAITGPITVAGTPIPTYSSDHPGDQVHGATAISDLAVEQVKLSVIMTWPDGYTNDGQLNHGGPKTKTVDKPGNCETPPTKPTTTPPTTPATTSPTPTPTETTPELPVPTPSTTDEPNPFTPIVEEDCDTITIGADNPADGITWTIGFETSKGEKRAFTIKPGEKKTEKFSAVTGFWVKVTVSVTIKGETYSDFTKIEYQKPGDCSGQGGGLPVTGAAAGGIAGGAAILLVAGAVLFMLARRRKVNFTA